MVDYVTYNFRAVVVHRSCNHGQLLPLMRSRTHVLGIRALSMHLDATSRATAVLWCSTAQYHAFSTLALQRTLATGTIACTDSLQYVAILRSSPRGRSQYKI